MNTSTFWSSRRNRMVSGCVGVGVAAAAVFGVGAAAQAANTSSITPAASVSSPSPSAHSGHSGSSDAKRLRQAMHGVRALPASERPAALAKVKADVLAGKYGTKADHDLTALDAVAASDPAGMRGPLLRLSGVHPHHHAPKSGSTKSDSTKSDSTKSGSTTKPSPSPSSSSTS